MNQEFIDLWADIGSEDYWRDLIATSQGLVPFRERWPQPGFVGNQYLDSRPRVAVMGQNPRATNTSLASASDVEMFRLIRRHAELRTEQSLNELFRMMRDFMLGTGIHRPAWRPITAARNHLGLSLDTTAYLNLIPLATDGNLILPVFSAAYRRSTAKQLDLLKPEKIVVYGKGAYQQFRELSDLTNVRYIEQRNFSLAPSVKEWLAT